MGGRYEALQDELPRMDVLHRGPHVSPSLSHARRVLTERCSRQHLYDDARRVFRDIAHKNIDWPEAIWEAWVSFEQLHGSVEQIEDALDRIERARTQVNNRRAKVGHHRPCLPFCPDE